MKPKFIYESLNEIISFERKKDPLSSLGIGKRKLIEDWLEKMILYSYKLNEDLTIDIFSGIDFSDENLIEFPNYIQFNKTYNHEFYCHENKLISLRGCPIECGHFACRNNELTSLKYSPKIVRGNFRCNNNLLTSLNGCPSIVEQDFYCHSNKVQFSIADIPNYCKIYGNIIFK